MSQAVARAGLAAADWAEPASDEIPVREWVVSFSPPVRSQVAADPSLLGEALTRIVWEILAWQKRRAGAIDETRCRARGKAATTFAHRFGSAVDLSLRLHVFIPDGVFVFDGDHQDERVRFVALSPPSNNDLSKVLGEIIIRIERLLRHRGRLVLEAGDTARLMTRVCTSPACPFRNDLTSCEGQEAPVLLR